jgi:glutathione S-transferase
MTYVLAIGERSYSSWSLRGWLLFANFGIPVETVALPLDSPGFAAGLVAFAPARTVPALRIAGEGAVWDTLAIAETLAERHPEAAHWPEAPGARALARALAAEMHSGFAALRAGCPMNLRTAFEGYAPSEAVLRDLRRIETLWDATPGGREGPWLFGRYTVADAFYAPVAARIAGYGLPVGPRAAAYVAAHLADPGFRAWRAEALADTRRLEADECGLPERPWPGA